MIIFRGWGILVLIIGLVCFMVTTTTIAVATQDGQYFETHRWPKLVACLATAAVVWPVGRWFNKPRLGEETHDSVPDEQLARILRSRHTLFFIPMEYWSPIIAFFGVAFWLAR